MFILGSKIHQFMDCQSTVVGYFFHRLQITVYATQQTEKAARFQMKHFVCIIRSLSPCFVQSAETHEERPMANFKHVSYKLLLLCCDFYRSSWKKMKMIAVALVKFWQSKQKQEEAESL